MRTGSNVLLEAADSAHMSRSSVRAARLWLTEQLTAYEHAKLGQGGHTQNQVPLRRVFVDLPIADDLSAEATPDGERTFFLSQFLNSRPMRFRSALHPQGSAMAAADVEELERVSPRRRVRSRESIAATLLVGGPGQGKSTLGQLACQLHRAALLLPYVQDLTSSERDLVQSFERADFGGRPLIRIPSTPSLPLQVSLPDFAGWLGREQVDSVGTAPALLRFLADLPSARASGVTSDDLLLLACRIPVLLVLDGFDEVGALLDRERIVAEARTLLQQLATANGTGHVLASTRPQGYAGELARVGIPLRPVYLSPLRREEALGYAKKLVEAKIPGADDQRKALERLHEAALEPATERLLTTPLQVTILSALVQQLGRAPRERWNLFSRYFAYTYDREIERGTFASRLLAEHRGHIERIHARVALLLQVEAERDGGGAAKMSRAHLEGVIHDVLAEEEIAETELSSLVKEIATAAEQRLVFVVEPEPGCFGFEIRSLQEFMAAWALTSGREQDINARLLQVVRASMFRNVVLFMASRFYSEGMPQRETIADKICPELDNDPHDLVGRATRAGSLFALETLEEGAVLSQPKRARALMERAVGLLALPAGTEHTRLARVNTADTLPVLRSAVEGSLQTGHVDGGAVSTASVLVLIQASASGEQWAIDLLERFWPDLMRDQTWLVACQRLSIVLSHWVVRKIESDSAAFTPERLLLVRVAPTVASASWMSWMRRVFTEAEVWRHRHQVLPISQVRADADRIDEPIGKPEPQGWSGWIAAARFELNPNRATLAQSLRRIAASAEPPEWRSLEWRSSWPLAACLAAASSGEVLLSFAEDAEAGRLGDIADWIRIQRNWPDRIDIAASIRSAIDNVPWSVPDTERAPPLLLIPAWLFGGPTHPLVKGSAFAAHRAAKDRFFDLADGKLKTRVAELCLATSRSLTSAKNSPTQEELLEFVSAAPHFAHLLDHRPPNLDTESWLRVLDRGARPRGPWFLDGPNKALSALVEAKGHPLLLKVAAMHAELYCRHRVGAVDIEPGKMRELRGFVSTLSYADAPAKADLFTLKAWLGLLSEGGEDEQHWVVMTEAFRLDPDVWTRFAAVVPQGKYSAARAAELYATTLLHGGRADAQAFQIVQRLRELLQARRSDLHVPLVWRRLGLQGRSPGLRAPRSGTPAIPHEPVCLSWIRLTNIGGIANLRLDFPEPEPEKGQWVVLLGPNGVGKTTVLRSLLLALRNVRDPSIWPRGAFSVGWRRLPKDQEPPLAQSQIEVSVAQHGSFKVTIGSHSAQGIEQAPELEQPRLFPLFAYGCRRGSALGGAARQVDLTDDDGPEVATLFDEGADLIHAETWLLQLDGDAHKNDRSKQILEAVKEALCVLLNVAAVEISEKRVWIKERGKPLVPLANLSDGYLTSAGWFLDLLARWLALCEVHAHPVAEDFPSRMTGLVLIDEIDLHLHPRWQVEIIDRTRRLLPRMTFVVTTHNPLTLVGARAEEVWKLGLRSGEVYSARGEEAPMLLTGGQIYRRYFGIDDIYPESVGRALQRYSFLSAYAQRDENEQQELEGLSELLQRHGISPGWDTVERAEASPNGTTSKLGGGEV